jgi:hypothetical protein
MRIAFLSRSCALIAVHPDPRLTSQSTVDRALERSSILRLQHPWSPSRMPYLIAAILRVAVLAVVYTRRGHMTATIDDIGGSAGVAEGCKDRLFPFVSAVTEPPLTIHPSHR